MTSARDFDSTLFEDAVDVPTWLEADRPTPLAERRRRDREIALSIEAHDPVERVRAWWRRLDTPDRPAPRRRPATASRLPSLEVLVVGAPGRPTVGHSAV